MFRARPTLLHLRAKVDPNLKPAATWLGMEMCRMSFFALAPKNESPKQNFLEFGFRASLTYPPVVNHDN